MRVKALEPCYSALGVGGRAVLAPVKVVGEGALEPHTSGIFKEGVLQF